MNIQDAPYTQDAAQVIDLERGGEIRAEHVTPQGRHLVLVNAGGTHRIWARETSRSAPLALLITIDHDFATRHAAGARFAQSLLLSSSRTPSDGRRLADRSYYPSHYRCARLGLLLNLLDAEHAGLSRREIAANLLYRNTTPLTGADWKGSSERRHTHRLIHEAHLVRDVGYRQLLHGR